MASEFWNYPLCNFKQYDLALIELHSKSDNIIKKYTEKKMSMQQWRREMNTTASIFSSPLLLHSSLPSSSPPVSYLSLSSFSSLSLGYWVIALVPLKFPSKDRELGEDVRSLHVPGTDVEGLLKLVWPSWVGTAPFFHCKKIKSSESFGNPQKKKITYISLKR